MSERPAFDVLIAGGGMVGASLALALAPTGWRIGLVEPTGLAVAASPSFDDRATALSWSSRQFLSALGLWADLAEGACPIRHIHVSEQGRFGRTRLHAGDIGVDALGHVLPNRLLGQALKQGLAERDNVSVIEAAALAAEQHADQVVLKGENETAWSTRLLVVADGARSRLRDSLGIASRSLRYPHAALVANLEVERPHEGWAFERFTPSGPLAMLPLPDDEYGRHRMNLVLSVDQSEAEAWVREEDSRFLQRLKRRFGAHLGALRGVGQRSVYPLFQVRARELVRDRVVLAGNAALALHPVAGQGFNLALRGVGDLAERLMLLAAEGGDSGDADMLTAHARHRKTDLDHTAAWTRGLVETFTLGLPGLAPLRSSALLGLDRLDWVRNHFARQAMGRKPGLSSLSRGVRRD